MSQELLDHVYSEKFVVEKWLQDPIQNPTFLEAESSLILGSNNCGKSRFLMRLLMMFRLRNHQMGRKVRIIDCFGARNDAESTNHFLNPATKDTTCAIVGDDVQVEGLEHTVSISDFSIEDLTKYEIWVTDRRFFGPNKPPEVSAKCNARYYSALAHIFKECQEREDPSELVVLAMREIANVVYSINKAGISRDQQQAQEEFRSMHSMRYHAKIACVMDTQRFTDSLASVRSLADFVYLKGFGRQPIPHELSYLYKPHLFGDDPKHGWLNPRNYMMRNIEVDHFIMLPPSNGVAIGWFGDIPWHIKKGMSPLKKLGVKVTLKPKEETNEVKSGNPLENEFKGAVFVPSPNELHRLMQQVKNDPKLNDPPYKEVARILTERGIKTSWQTVSYHMGKRCACEATSSS